MSIGIYKIVNPKGKIYIGQSKNIEKRVYQNYQSENCKNQIKLYNSLQKYGWTQHKFEIIEECKINELDEKEIYWGQFYNSLDKHQGLNLRLGSSNSKHIFSKETKEKMRNAKLGKKRPKKVGLAISKGKKGYKYSKERDKKISEKTKGKPKPKGFGEKIKKTIIQCDLQGNFIREWNSVQEAGEFFNIKPSSISNNLTGISKSSAGFFWKYKTI